MRDKKLHYIQKFGFLTVLRVVWHLTDVCFYLCKIQKSWANFSNNASMHTQPFDDIIFNCHLHLQMVHLVSDLCILMVFLTYSLWLTPVERKLWVNPPTSPVTVMALLENRLTYL